MSRHGCSEHHGCGLHPLVPAPTHSHLCVSTAVDISTATCNSACRSTKLECPESCFCLDSGSNDKASNLSLTMPAEDFSRLMGELDSGSALLPGRLSSLTREAATPEVTVVTEKKVCKSLQISVASSFCDINCNAEPPNCPESVCSCPTVKKQWKAQSEVPEAPQAAVDAPAAAPAAVPAQPKPIWTSHLSTARPAKLPDGDLRGFCELLPRRSLAPLVFAPRARFHLLCVPFALCRPEDLAVQEP